jgi:hypothetical protein
MKDYFIETAHTRGRAVQAMFSVSIRDNTRSACEDQCDHPVKLPRCMVEFSSSNCCHTSGSQVAGGCQCKYIDRFVSVFEGHVYTRFYTLRHAPVYRRVRCNEIHACQDTPGHVSVSGGMFDTCPCRKRTGHAPYTPPCLETLCTRLQHVYTRPHVPHALYTTACLTRVQDMYTCMHVFVLYVWHGPYFCIRCICMHARLAVVLFDS